MSFLPEFPRGLEDPPSDLIERRDVGVEFVDETIRLLEDKTYRLAGERLLSTLYLFRPGVLGGYGRESYLSCFIDGYANRSIVPDLLNQIKNIANILYFTELELYQAESQSVVPFGEAFKSRAVPILKILNQWLNIQDGDRPIPISQISELDPIDLVETLGWETAAKFALFRDAEINNMIPVQIQLGDQSGGQVYDLNFTPDKINRVASKFTYLMWESERITDPIEIFTTLYTPALGIHEQGMLWWNLPQIAPFKDIQFDTVLDRRKIRHHMEMFQEVYQFNRLLDPHTSRRLMRVWKREYTTQHNSDVLDRQGPVASRDMFRYLYRLFGEKYGIIAPSDDGFDAFKDDIDRMEKK